MGAIKGETRNLDYSPYVFFTPVFGLRVAFRLLGTYKLL